MDFIRYTISFLLLCNAVNAFSQNTDEKVAALLNDYIPTQRKYSAIKKDMQGVSIVKDLITKTEEIRYAENINPKTKAAFAKYSKEEQFKILNSPSFIVGDTLTIVDPSGFFGQHFYVFKERPYIKVVSNADNVLSDKPYMELEKYTLKGNDMLACTYVDAEGGIYNYSLKLNEDVLTIVQMEGVPPCTFNK